MVGAEHAHTGSRLVALDGVVTEVGVHLDAVDAVDDCGVLDQCGAEGEGVPHALVDEGLGVGCGFVVELDGAVAVEGEAFTCTGVTVDDAVSDHDAGGTEAVVVTVDRPDAIVLRGNVRGGVDDVLTELVVGEGATQQGCVVELDVCYEGDDRIGAAAGGGGGDGDRAFVSGKALAVDLHAGQFGGVCSGGAGGACVCLGCCRLVGGGVFDFGVLCQVAVVCPACAATDYCECAEAAADEDSTGELLLG